MIERIDRLDDPRTAEYGRIGDPSWLLENGLFVAEGRLVVQRLLEGRRFAVKSVLLTPPALSALGSIIDTAGAPAYVCDQQTMSGIAGFNFHRGCLAIGERPRAAPALESFASSRRLLALEGVGNPDNVGGLFRVAAAFDVGGVILDRATADPLYRKAIRTSMGASLRIPFARCEAWLSQLHALRRQGTHLVALTPDRSAMPLPAYAARAPADGRLALMVGAEGPGLTDAAFSIADALVRIPIDSAVDSLNVVVAAGIALATLR